MNANVDIHLVLPGALVAGVDDEARRKGSPRAQVIREAIAEYLARIEAERLADEMRIYADELGDASGEFVAELEEHTRERLLRDTTW